MSGFKGAYRSMGYTNYENIILTPMQYSGVIKGTWSIGKSAPYLLTHALTNSTGATIAGVNDEVFFNQSLDGGIYNIIVSYYRDVNTGTANLIIDGIPFGAVIDTYGAASATITTTFQNVQLEQGAHTFGFRIAGKNASSSAYYMSFQQLIIQRIG
jgi:hypothetical protein